MRLHIVLVSYLCLASACGGDDAAADGDTRLVDLDEAGSRTYCEAEIENDRKIAARIAAECPGRQPPRTETVDECVASLGLLLEECQATVDDGQSCLEALLADACEGTLILCTAFASCR